MATFDPRPPSARSRRIDLEDLGNPRCKGCRQRKSEHRVEIPEDWSRDQHILVKCLSWHCAITRAR